MWGSLHQNGHHGQRQIPVSWICTALKEQVNTRYCLNWFYDFVFSPIKLQSQLTTGTLHILSFISINNGNLRGVKNKFCMQIWDVFCPSVGKGPCFCWYLHGSHSKAADWVSWWKLVMRRLKMAVRVVFFEFGKSPILKHKQAVYCYPAVYKSTYSYCSHWNCINFTQWQLM